MTNSKIKYISHERVRAKKKEKESKILSLFEIRSRNRKLIHRYWFRAAKFLACLSIYLIIKY
jgi:hypothetical protein